jgi:hypothetical protein
MEREAKDTIISEENKLPLTFDYMELFSYKSSDHSNSSASPPLKCEKYQTENHHKQVPCKPITRML